MKYDLLIKGGEVLDPGRGLGGRLDVALAKGRIVELAEAIPASSAKEVFGAAGLLVTPGLIDLHTHLGWPIHEVVVPVDETCLRSGVTTCVDAGSTGAYTFPWFRRRVIEPSRTRLLPFLNICSIGAIAVHTPYYEEKAIEYADVDEAVRTVEENRDLIVGIKVFAAQNMVGEHGLENLKRAREAADRAGVPLMVHISVAPPPVEVVVAFLRAGDILTHSFTEHSQRILDENGSLRAEVLEAWNRGAILDIGHGSGSFNFEIAEAMFVQGYRPDTISTDLYGGNVHGPVYDLPTTLSKFLLLGMSLEEVIMAATIRPAKALRVEGKIGSLKVGGVGDVAVLALEEGEFQFWDAQGNLRTGKKRLRAILTVRGGVPGPVMR